MSSDMLRSASWFHFWAWLLPSSTLSFCWLKTSTCSRDSSWNPQRSKYRSFVIKIREENSEKRLFTTRPKLGVRPLRVLLKILARRLKLQSLTALWTSLTLLHFNHLSNAKSISFSIQQIRNLSSIHFQSYGFS